MSEYIEQFWRSATPDDVARVMRGEAVEARFRDDDSGPWYPRNLAGWSDSAFCCESGSAWIKCQVYDPPAWFANKPEPGEGYRLLGKFPPEARSDSDEWWNAEEKLWYPSQKGDSKQHPPLWYRRRIETNNPAILDSSNSSETPNSCRSRDTIPSGWRLLGKDEDRIASDAYWSQGAKDWIIIGDDRVSIANMLVKWHAIRQCGVAEYYLCEGCKYSLPSGKVVQVTAKGFEVV